MRLDDVPPGVAFEAASDSVGPELPQTVSAEVSDEHSGPASGEIEYRRLNAERWIELPTKLQPNGAAGVATLAAPVPAGFDPGTYVFRADAKDGAGNTASTTRRADGTEMALRKTPPPVGPSRAADGQGKVSPSVPGIEDPALRKAALAPPSRLERDRALRCRGCALGPSAQRGWRRAGRQAAAGRLAPVPWRPRAAPGGNGPDRCPWRLQACPAGGPFAADHCGLSGWLRACRLPPPRAGAEGSRGR